MAQSLASAQPPPKHRPPPPPQSPAAGLTSAAAATASAQVSSAFCLSAFPPAAQKQQAATGKVKAPATTVDDVLEFLLNESNQYVSQKNEAAAHKLGNIGDLPTAPRRRAAKKSLLQSHLAAQDRRRRDVKGWELLQEGADASLAYDILADLQDLMECGRLEKHSGLCSCRVRPIPQPDLPDEDGQRRETTDAAGHSISSLPSIHRYDFGGESTYNIVGLQNCSSPMKCPVCGRKITYFRRIQIAWGVWLLLEDHKVYVMATLTAPHRADTDPVKFVDSFCAARRDLMKCAGWKNVMKKYNYYGMISGNEATVDAPWSSRKTGMHYHSHCLFFFERPSFSNEELKDLSKELALAWTDACQKHNLVSNAARADHLAHGLDISQYENERDTGILGIKAADYVAKNVSFEVAPPPGSKAARRPDRLNQWQLMLLATTTHPELISDLDRVLQALNSRRLTYWSKGIQKKYGVPSTDQIKEVFKNGGDFQEVLSENVKIAQKICGEVLPATSVPVSSLNEEEAMTEDMAEVMAYSIEPEEEEAFEEDKGDGEIIKGEAAEEILQVSLLDWAHVVYYGASYKLLKSIPTHDVNGLPMSVDDAATCAKIALQLIAHGIDPVTFAKLTPRRADLQSLLFRARRAEAQRQAAGFENPPAMCNEPLLFDFADLE